jgi:DedD protein
MDGRIFDERKVDEQTDTEITLGVGKLVGLFFAVVVLCAVFFGIGFSLGKSSVPSNATELIPSSSSSASAKPAAASGAVAAQSAAPVTEPTSAADSSSQPAAEPISASTTEPVEKASMPAAPATTAPQARTAPEVTHAAAAPSGATNAPTATAYVVQVAAVRKKEDAEALVAALKRKQYAAFVVSNPLVDPLFHVQIGPFTDSKDADALKTRLINDGYTPIVKR